MSTHDRHDPRCGVCVLCEFSMIRARILPANVFSSSIFTFVALVSWVSSLLSWLWFVYVIVRLPLEILEVGLHPSDAFIEPLIERYFVLPPQSLPQLCAVQHVSSVLAHALADNLDAIIEFRAEFGHDTGNQLPDRN